MGEFGWAYIAGGGITASGPQGALQYRVAYAGGETRLGGTDRLVYHSDVSTLTLSGTLLISGTISASAFVVHQTDTISGSTIFGNSNDDSHQFTGSIYGNRGLYVGNHLVVTGSTILGGADPAPFALTVNGTSIFEDDVRVNDNKRIFFGTNTDASIAYDEAGINRLVISGPVAGTDISGNVHMANNLSAKAVTVTNGDLIVSGSSFLGEDCTDNTVIQSRLTGNCGILLPDDKKAIFGSALPHGDAYIVYDEATQNRLIISGSATGLSLGGGSIAIDYPGKAIKSGTLAGVGSYVGLSSTNELILAEGVTITNDADNRITTANGSSGLNAEANLTFDGSTLTVTGDSSLNGSVTINEAGADKDFRVEAADESHMLFVDAGANRISIGDNTGTPGATLEVKNHASAGATGVPLLQLNNNDTDQQCLDINAGNIDANVVNITANDVTTARVLAIGADGLTTGNALYVDDNSPSTGTRKTALIIQNHTGAINAQALTVQSDGGKTGIKLDKNYSDLTEASIIGLDIDWDKTGASTSDNTMYGIQIDMDNTTATNGNNTMYGIHVTPTLTHAANAGTPIVYGALINAQGGTNGTSLVQGARIEAGGGDINYGLQLDVEDGGVDLRIESSADNGDYFQIQTTTHGATTITTVDDNATAADLTFNVDGDITLDPVGGNVLVDGNLSASANISGSELYATRLELRNVGGSTEQKIYFRGATHDDVKDAEISFDDNSSGAQLLTIQVGGQEFMRFSEASNDILEINEGETANFKFIVNNTNGEVITCDNGEVVINQDGQPNTDFRVESNQKTRAIFLDSNDQYLRFLEDTTAINAADTAIFFSGTVGQRGGAIRNVAVFGGDVVLSGALHALEEATFNDDVDFFDDVKIVDDKLLFFGTDQEASIKYDEAGINRLIISGAVAGTDISSSVDFADEVTFHDDVTCNDSLTLAAGDGALNFSVAGQNSIKIPDAQAVALTIEEANNAYLTFVTTNTAEKIVFDVDAKIKDNKNLIFGDDNDAVIQYDEATQNRLIISGSATGISFGGGSIALDYGTTADKTISSGTAAGGGSFLALAADNTLVVASPGGGDPAGSNTEIQFNNDGSFGASSNFTLENNDELTMRGTFDVFSGSGAGGTKVFSVEESDGSTRGRMVQTIMTQFDLTSGGQAKTGRFISIGGNRATVNNSLSRLNGMLTPFSGRLISITYHFPAGGANQDATKGRPQFALFVADVNQLNGNTFTSAVEVSMCTASSWPGANHVGGVNVQTGQGTKTNNNTTGSWSFGTGSAVGLFFRSGDSSSNNYPGQAAITTVWEFDQLDPFVSGSGN